ncbi:hypothetical protein N9L68_04045 [bacterium]|nr:hypothetical protein [bacterium]
MVCHRHWTASGTSLPIVGGGTRTLATCPPSPTQWPPIHDVADPEHGVWERLRAPLVPLRHEARAFRRRRAPCPQVERPGWISHFLVCHEQQRRHCLDGGGNLVARRGMGDTDARHVSPPSQMAIT